MQLYLFNHINLLLFLFLFFIFANLTNEKDAQDRKRDSTTLKEEQTTEPERK